MKMKNALTVVTAVGAAMFAQATFAQASSPTRAEVKAETKAAGVAKEPHGEAADTPTKPTKTSSTESRSEVKAEAKAAPKMKAGQGDEPTTPTGKSTKTKAQRKAETAAAKAKGELQPEGQK